MAQNAFWGEPTVPGNGMEGYYAPVSAPSQDMGLLDPQNYINSMLPIFQRNQQQQIGSAISSLAPGNRYSSEAYRQAGLAGGNNAMDMNSFISKTLLDQANTNADRSMGAAGMQMQGAGMTEDALSQRYGQYSGALKERMSQWNAQKARQMAVARMQYADFEKNKYGTLPMLMGMANNSIGQGPEPILSTSPGKQGYGSDILRLLAAYGFD